MEKFLLLAVALYSASVTAETLVDPTRPPSVVEKSAPGAEPTPAGSGLQSIFISPQRRVALIDGKEVPVGGRVGEAKLVQIAEDHIVLKDAQGTRSVALLPGIEKRPPLSTVAGAGGQKSNRRTDRKAHDVR